MLVLNQVLMSVVSMHMCSNATASAEETELVLEAGEGCLNSGGMGPGLWLSQAGLFGRSPRAQPCRCRVKVQGPVFQRAIIMKLQKGLSYRNRKMTSSSS